MKIAAVGFVCIDVYENLNKLYPTGNGVDFLINLMRFGGVEGAVVSAVGQDKYGELMRNTLKLHGIDTSHLRTENGKTAVIKMDLVGRDRVHGERIRGVMDNYTLTDEDIEFIKTQDMIHTDLSSRAKDRLPEIKKSGVKVVFDFSVKHDNPDNKNILPYVDYAFFSFGENSGDVTGFMKRVKSYGPEVVVATLGKKGSIAYDGEKFYRDGIVLAEIVNTVGAGDSFAAGFMHGIIQDRGIEASMKEGTALAAKVVSQFEPY